MDRPAARRNPVIGFIGCGKMAQAMIRGMIQGFVTPPSNMHAADPDKDCTSALSDIGINIHDNNVDVAKNAEVIVIAVKPDIAPSVLKEIASTVGSAKLVVSIVAGLLLKTIQKVCHFKVARERERMRVSESE